MGIKKMIQGATAKVANTIAKGAVLSPDELERINEQKEAYYAAVPNPNDAEAQELTRRILATYGVSLYHSYLNQLDELYLPYSRNAEYSYKNADDEWTEVEFSSDYNVRYFNITKWVTDKKENSLEKLVNVYEVLSNENCNIGLIFNRKVDTTKVYLAVSNARNDKNKITTDNYEKRIKDAIRGNFPGSEFGSESGLGALPCVSDGKEYSVAIASNIPTEKSKQFETQTIEKLLDGIVPESAASEYTIVLIATPVLDVEERKNMINEFYSAMKPMAEWQTHFTVNESMTEGSSMTVGINVGANAGRQSGSNSSTANTEGETDSKSKTTGKTETHTDTHTEGKTTTKSVGVSASETVNFDGGINIGPFKIGSSTSTSIGVNASKAVAKSVSDSVSDSVANTVSKTVGKAISKSKTVTEGFSKMASFGVNAGMNFARSSSVTAQVGIGETIVQSFENHSIKHAMEYIDKQVKRLDQSVALGMWDFAAYFLSEDINVAENVANSYIALTQGEESYLASSAVNSWRGDRGEESVAAQEIVSYIREMRHPLFVISPDAIEADNDFLVYPELVNATTSLTGKELAYSLNFPKKSIPGLPVIECAEFGRNINSYDEIEDESAGVHLGAIFHMNHVERVQVNLGLQSLTAHTFITGSTGVGKSNSVYQILNECSKMGVKFLVVEPAKGEYKHALGNRDDVNVFGTNPKVAELLKVNPFSFPEDIHVLEHIDRLVEIFNVCWPMYAAMPAVLKNAVEKSYVDCGWNLVESSNKYGDNLYPTFGDVCRNVRSIIDSSEYDSENKGAYKGSLLTRLQSLTNGLNGMIFAKDEIGSEKLFDENTIIDLSRIGSMETKALLMGIIVLKLQEYRMARATDMNAKLKHVTVLEEAHNLLKRTSTEQASESANLLGKSVEMISNAIAEMRTYGEGFIIADQSPGLLDMSAIRNTNTKIIMRLPDLADRELVGKAASLNDEQIAELVKLPRGVAAVYQDEWIQPVLCKVEKADVSEDVYLYTPLKDDDDYPTVFERIELLESIVSCHMVEPEIREYLVGVTDRLMLDGASTAAIYDWLYNPLDAISVDKLAEFTDSIVPEVKRVIVHDYDNSDNPSDWTENAYEILSYDVLLDNERDAIVRSVLTNYLSTNNYSDYERWANMLTIDGGLKL